MVTSSIRMAGTYLLAASVCGCASSSMTVTKVMPGQSAAGVRYSLPQPFLMVVPNTAGDGGFSTEVVYLPDECQTYAIDASTRRGKYQLDIVVKDGLLSKVEWNTKDTQALNVEAIRATGELAKGEIDRREKASEEEKKKHEDAVKAADDAVKASATALRDRNLDVQLAEAKVTSASAAVAEDPSATTRAALRAAELERDQAIIRRDEASRAVERARSVRAALPAALDAGSASGAGTASGAGGQTTTPPGPTFWGPILYRIVDDASGVRLVAADWRAQRRPDDCVTGAAQSETTTNPSSSATGAPAAPQAAQPPPGTRPQGPVKQPKFNTAMVKRPEEKTPAPAMKNQPTMSIPWPASGTLSITLEFDAPFDAVLQADRQIRRLQPTPRADVDKTLYSAVPDAERRKIVLTFTERLPKGIYRIVVPFMHSGEKNDPNSGTKASATLQLEIEK